MESSEFAIYFKKFPIVNKLFDGTFSIDTIPITLKLHHFIICNTDLSSGLGKHWFCLLRRSRNEIECFDSLGITEEKKKVIIQAVKIRGIQKLLINSSPVQLPTTDTCGKFCVMFVLERLHNFDMDFDELLNAIFSDDCSQNEQILANFFDDIIG